MGGFDAKQVIRFWSKDVDTLFRYDVHTALSH